MKIKKWVAEHVMSKSFLQKDGKVMVVEASNKGDARHIFKKVHGEKTFKKSKGRNTSTGRIRLPAGYRVKNAERCLPAQ